MIRRIAVSCIVIFLIFSVYLISAQDKTGYFLGLSPQKSDLNPAYSYNRTLIIFNPSVNFSIANSSLTFHAMFNKGKGDQDTLLFWDFDKIERKLGKSNFFYSDASVNLFFAGKPFQGNRYATLQFSRKYHGYFAYPRSFVDLRLGNADLAHNKPRTIDLNNYSINGLVYDEISLGLSKIYSDKLSAGIHVKLLQGKMGIKTTRFLASIVTSNDFTKSVLTTDAIIKLSAPILEKGTSRLKVDMTELQDQLSWYYYSLKNIGAAVDFGVISRIDENTTLSASLNDIGFILWGAKPQQLVSKGEYLFDGFYFSSQNLNNFDAKNYFKAYTDTLQSVFSPRQSDRPFTNRLSARAYLGLSHRYNPELNFTGLLKATLFPENLLIEASIGAVYRPKKRIALSGNWSYSNRSLYNIGLGASYTGKQYQVYAMTDNINGITILDCRGLNIALGISWILFQKIDEKQDSNRTFIMQ
jgi:hypothetical protein